MTLSFHYCITPAGQKIEYVRIQRKIGKVSIGQTLALARLPVEPRPIRS